MARKKPEARTGPKVGRRPWLLVAAPMLAAGICLAAAAAVILITEEGGLPPIADGFTSAADIVNNPGAYMGENVRMIVSHCRELDGQFTIDGSPVAGRAYIALGIGAEIHLASDSPLPLVTLVMVRGAVARAELAGEEHVVVVVSAAVPLIIPIPPLPLPPI